MNGKGNRIVDAKPMAFGPEGFPVPSSYDGPPAQSVRGCIDLHMHSKYSDGFYEPEWLVQWAKHLGLRAISLTDHDTMKAVPRAIAEGKRLGVEVIPGTEISVAYSGGTFHLLAYFVDPENRQFTDKLEDIAFKRHARNQRIVEKLAQHGMHVSYDEIRAEAGEGVVGRPHIARVLVKHGYSRDVQQAFDEWLGDGKPCFMEKETFGPEQAIKHVRACGGVPVMAHPFWLNRPDLADLESYLAELKGYGLMGVECVYSDHPAEFRQACIDIARRLGLVVTGGADFHGGTVKPEVTMGHGPGGGFKIDAELLDDLYKARDLAKGAS